MKKGTTRIVTCIIYVATVTVDVAIVSKALLHSHLKLKDIKTTSFTQSIGLRSIELLKDLCLAQQQDFKMIPSIRTVLLVRLTQNFELH